MNCQRRTGIRTLADGRNKARCAAGLKLSSRGKRTTYVEKGILYRHDGFGAPLWRLPSHTYCPGRQVPARLP